MFGVTGQRVSIPGAIPHAIVLKIPRAHSAEGDLAISPAASAQSSISVMLNDAAAGDVHAGHVLGGLLQAVSFKRFSIVPPETGTSYQRVAVVLYVVGAVCLLCSALSRDMARRLGGRNLHLQDFERWLGLGFGTRRGRKGVGVGVPQRNLLTFTPSKLKCPASE